MRQYIVGPLAAQTVSGTLTGVIRGLESNANLNATVAINVRQVGSTGTHVNDLLAVAASDNTGAAPRNSLRRQRPVAFRMPPRQRR